MTEDKKKIRFNLNIYVFIIIASITIINDNIIFFTKMDYGISLLISSILVIFANVCCIKKKLFEIKTDFHKLDLIAIIPYTIIYFIIMLRIDDFIDSVSYHLYNQRHPFIDRINFDLLPSSSFFFPLGDRMNYIFVNFLGYRLGLIFSGYASIIIYYQIKNFLSLIIPDMKEKIKIIISAMMLYTFSVNLCIGEYSIDIYSTVILLELLYLVIRNINIFEEKNYLYLSVFLAGIAIGIKISNIVFATVLLLYMLVSSFKSLKKIRFYDILLCILLLLIPFGMYMINSYIQTGNPIFPFYNSIFKSVYYKDVSAKDMRLGPKNFLETILWPLIITVIPIRGDDIRGLVDPIWLVGYILSIYCFIKERKNKNVFRLAMLNVFITAVWIFFVCGYVRYGMFIAISYFFIEVYILNKIISNIVLDIVNFKNIFKLSLKLILIMFMEIQILLSISMGMVYIYEKLKVSISDFQRKALVNENQNKYDIDGVWIACRYNTAYIDLIRNQDDPMYNADIIVTEDPMMKVESSYSDISRNIFLDKTKRKKIVYNSSRKVF